MSLKNIYASAKRALSIEIVQEILILTIFLIIFFAPTIFTLRINSASDNLQKWTTFSITGKEYVRQNTLLSDPMVQSEPWFKFSKDSLFSGHLPLWNPHQGNGTPLIANMQSAFFFPLSWLVFLLNFKLGLLLLYFFRLFFAGFSAYLYLKQIKIHHFAAVIGSVAFMFCGYNMVWLYWPIANMMFFLPFSLFLVEKIIHSKEKIYPWIFSAATALALFGGHPETFTHIFLVTFLYFIFKLLFLSNPENKKGVIIWNFSKGIIFGILLASIQLVPFLEYLFRSAAYQIRTFSENPYYLNPFLSSLNLTPDLFGNPAYHQYFIKLTNYNESAGGYIGLAMLFFAFMSLALLRKKKIIQFFAFLSFFSLAVVYKVPVIFKIFTLLPVFNKAANHRMLFIFAFGMIVIGAHLLSEIFNGKLTISKKKRLISFTAFLFILIFLCVSAIRNLAPWLTDQKLYPAYLKSLAAFTIADLILLFGIIMIKKQKIFFASLLVLVFAETGIHGLFYQPAIEKRLFFPENRLTDFLKNDLGDYRVTSVSDSAFLNPNVGTFYGISDIKNYDAMLVNDYRNELARYSNNSTTFQAFKSVDKQYLDLAGVKYIIAASQKELAKKLSLNDDNKASYPVAFEGNKFSVFENTNVLPRAFLVNSATAQSTMIEKKDLLSQAENKAQIIKYEPQNIIMETGSREKATLVLTDTFFPGWKAYVDGSETKISKTESAFRAVDLPSGNHEIIFKYQPKSFYWGFIVSLLTFMLIAFNLFRYWPCKKFRLGTKQ